jgi:F-type H+-transporting ATPase subunit epsilon
MAMITVDIVTAERTVFSDDAEVVVVPGIEGQMGILPHHIPLMTMLRAGEVLVRRGGEETNLAISGGFLEVNSDRVIILVDAAEGAEEIDVKRAEVAKRHAEKELSQRATGLDRAKTEAALRRALVRLAVVDKGKRRRRPGV